MYLSCPATTSFPAILRGKLTMLAYKELLLTAEQQVREMAADDLIDPGWYGVEEGWLFKVFH